MNLPAGIDRPLSIPEILDRSVTLAAQRWRTLFVLVLLEAVPIGIIRTIVPERPFALTLIWFVPDVLLCAVLHRSAIWTTAAISAPSTATALRAGLRRYGASLAVLVLGYVFLVGVAAVVALSTVLIGLLLVVLGKSGVAIGIFIGLVALLAVLPGATLIAAIAFPIVVLEDVSPWAAFAIAVRRVRIAGWWRPWFLGLAFVALRSAPTVVLGEATDRLVDVTHLSAFRFVDELLVDAISLAFGVVVATVIAIEMRVRYEGADLDAVMDHAVASAASSHSNGGASSAAASSAGSE